MAMKYKEVGGGAATGLADDFVGFLRQGLQTGSFGGAGATSQAGAADPFGSTAGIGGILNDLLAGGAGKIGGSMADMISRTQKQNVDALRARFGAGGGGAFGTPGAFAESTYRATEAPELTTAIGGLQQGALAQLLPLYASLAGKGIAQREGTFTPSPWMDVAKLGLEGGGAALGFFAGGPAGAAAGAQLGSSVGGSFNMAPNGYNPGNFTPNTTQFSPNSYSSSSDFFAPRNNPINFGFTPSLRF